MRCDPPSALIVDDSPQTCDLIREELSRCGFKCSIASPPVLATQLLDTTQFDLLVADASTSEVSGLDLLAHVKRRDPACKVILTAGPARREHLAQAIVLGAYDYLEKPLKTGQLAEVAAKAVRSQTDVLQLHVRAAEAMQLSSQVKQASLDSVRALARAVEAKDPFTRRHSEQVTYYAITLARAMNISEEIVESIRVASLVHDVGMIGVPDRILTKPGPLGPEELEQMRRHPALGADILSNITLFGEEARLVRRHHERWDGRGYPDGLTGEESPLPSRIMQVADCMDAMLMERSYKGGYGRQRMTGELVRGAGSQFDPRVAAVAVRWCRANPDKLVLTNTSPTLRGSPHSKSI